MGGRPATAPIAGGFRALTRRLTSGSSRTVTATGPIARPLRRPPASTTAMVESEVLHIRFEGAIASAYWWGASGSSVTWT